MVQVNFDDIPVNFKHLAQQVVELPEFIEEKSAMESFSTLPEEARILTVTYQGSSNGYTLFSVPEVDFWYTHTPHGTWLRSYIGYDAKYEQDVLVEKYNLMKLYDAQVSVFDNNKLPIYINRPTS